MELHRGQGCLAEVLALADQAINRKFFSFNRHFRIICPDKCRQFLGSCSSCSEEKSPVVPNPDPKQYWNSWKNDMSLFSATNQERPYEQLLHSWIFLTCSTRLHGIVQFPFQIVVLGSLSIQRERRQQQTILLKWIYVVIKFIALIPCRQKPTKGFQPLMSFWCRSINLFTDTAAILN